VHINEFQITVMCQRSVKNAREIFQEIFQVQKWI